MQEYSQPQDPRVERVLAHPTRSAILELLLGEKGLGPSSISEKLGIRPGNASYHVEVLTGCGAVEAVPNEKRRGEPLIRLPQPAPQRERNRPNVSDSRRDDVSAAQLKSLIEMAAHLRPGHAPGAS